MAKKKSKKGFGGLKKKKKAHAVLPANLDQKKKKKRKKKKPLTSPKNSSHHSQARHFSRKSPRGHAAPKSPQLGKQPPETGSSPKPPTPPTSPAPDALRQKKAQNEQAAAAKAASDKAAADQAAADAKAASDKAAAEQAAADAKVASDKAAADQAAADKAASDKAAADQAAADAKAVSDKAAADQVAADAQAEADKVTADQAAADAKAAPKKQHSAPPQPVAEPMSSGNKAPKSTHNAHMQKIRRKSAMLLLEQKNLSDLPDAQQEARTPKPSAAKPRAKPVPTSSDASKASGKDPAFESKFWEVHQTKHLELVEQGRQDLDAMKKSIEARTIARIQHLQEESEDVLGTAREHLARVRESKAAGKGSEVLDKAETFYVGQISEVTELLETLGAKIGRIKNGEWLRGMGSVTPGVAKADTA